MQQKRFSTTRQTESVPHSFRPSLGEWHPLSIRLHQPLQILIQRIGPRLLPEGSQRRSEALGRIKGEPLAGRRVSTRNRSNISTPVSRIRPPAPGGTLQPEINPCVRRSVRRTELINVAPGTGPPAERRLTPPADDAMTF
jgi:hypothetical protein